jgi:subtilisin family serine protease
MKTKTLAKRRIYLVSLLTLLLCFANVGYAVVLDGDSVNKNRQTSVEGYITIPGPGEDRGEADHVPGEVIVKLKDPSQNLFTQNYSTTKSSHAAVLNGIKDRMNTKHGLRLKDEKPVFKGLHDRLTTTDATIETLYARIEAKFPGRARPQNAKFVNLLPIYVLETDGDVLDTCAKLSQDPDVEYAQPNHIMELYMVPDDPYYSSSGSWGQGYDDLWALKPDRLNCEQAWDIPPQGEGVVVAVIDTGIDYNHEDVAENIWINDGEIPGNGIDDDGNHYVDDVRGYDFSDRDSNPSDYHGHGTHCAGTIAAVGNNGKDIIGVAPKAKVMAVKIFPYAYDTVCAQAIIYAANNGAKVLSNSWGPRSRMPSNPTIESAVDYAHSLGCVVVFSAGNKNDDVGYYSPANYLRTMAVAATDHNDAKASFSSWGHNLDVTAPGVEVLSLRAAGTDMYLGSTGYTAGERFVPPYDYTAKCYRANGTSMSCPHVAGLSALVRSQNPGFSNEEVRQVIRVSADDILEDGWDKYSGHGRIDAFQALQAGPVCVAVIDQPRQNYIVREGADIEGQAYGENFANYKLEYGESRDPDTWVTIATSSSAVMNGGLARWDTALLEDGEYTLRLTVEDINTRTYEFRCSVILERASISSPEPGSSFGGGETIPIQGTATGSNMQSYTIEYGAGEYPTQWSTDGITLVNGGTSEIIDGILGYWDISQITPSPDTSIYTLRLTVNYSGGVAITDAVSVSIDFSVEDGWPVKTAGSYFFSLAAVDLDGDGDKEIVKGEFDNYGSRRAKVYAFHHDGTSVDGWPFPGEYGYHQFKTPAIGDIDNDGELEIVIAGERSAGTLQEKGWWVLEEDGSVAPGWPIKISGLWKEVLNYGNLSLADLDGDGDLEIITSYGRDTIATFHHDGTMMEGWPVTAEAYYSGAPATGDIDGDGDLEVVLWSDPTDESGPANRGKVYAWHHDGQPVLGWPQQMVSSNSAWDSPVALADFDDDGAMEIVAKDIWGTVHIWRGDGVLLPGWPRGTSNGGCPFLNTTPLAIGDIDGDSDLEIVATNGFCVHVLQHTGESLPGWPVTLDNTIHMSAAIGDIDGDGAQEVVIGCNSGKLSAFKADGQMVQKFPKVLCSAILSAPVIDDIDLDGETEIIATSRYGNIYVWGTGDYEESSIEWRMFQNDLCRSGCYPYRGSLPPLPAPPSNLTATNVSFTIALSWEDNSDNEGGFKIERSLNPDSGFRQIGMVGFNTTSYTDTRLEPETTYYYRVCAYNKAGNSDYSNIANATTPVFPPEIESIYPTRGQVGQFVTIQGKYFGGEDGTRGSVLFHDGVEATILSWTDTQITCYVPEGAQKGDIHVVIKGRTSNGVYFNVLYPPAAPTELEAKAPLKNKVELNWTDNSTNETGFIIERTRPILPPAPQPLSTEEQAGEESFPYFFFVEIGRVEADVTTFVDTITKQKTTYLYRVCAYNGDGRTYSNIFRVTTPANKPPVLDEIGNKTVNEGERLLFEVSATDPDDVTLKFKAGPLPPGARFITPIPPPVPRSLEPIPIPGEPIPSGQEEDGVIIVNKTTPTFMWTPTYDQAGTYEITFAVSDGEFIDDEKILIEVHNVNRAPILDPIGNKDVKEGELLAFRVYAHDPDKEMIKLWADNLPAGAKFIQRVIYEYTPNGERKVLGIEGLVRWIPTYEEAGEYRVRFATKDEEFIDDETILIKVHNVNRAPILDPIGNKDVEEGELLTFRVYAHDPDKEMIRLWADNLPEGAEFIQRVIYEYIPNGERKVLGIEGLVSWTPTYEQAGAYEVTFSVADGEKIDTETITITVHNVTPAQLTAKLIDFVKSLNLVQGTENSLVSKLEGIIDALDKGNDTAALKKLNAFIEQVNEETGITITEKAAYLLIREAKLIIYLIEEGI